MGPSILQLMMSGNMSVELVVLVCLQLPEVQTREVHGAT